MSGGSWKVAYADFTTAMMAFFLLMWLLNVASEEQKAGIAGYFQAETNSSGSNASPMDVTNNPLIQYVDKLDTRQFKLNEIEESHYAIAQALKKYLLQDAKLSASSGITSDGIGVLLHVNNNVMFQPNSIEFTPEGFKTLKEVAEVMRKYKVYLVVRGHADISESGAPFVSKWELSSTRANAAVRHLIEEGQVDPKLIRSIAYADTRPLQPSTIPGAAQANSRVEFNFHRPEVMSTVVGY